MNATIYLLVLATNLACVDQVKQEQVAKCIKQLDSDDAVESETAAEQLAQLGPAAKLAVPRLIKSLEDERVTRSIPFGVPAPRPMVADAALDALVAIGKPATKALIERAEMGRAVSARRRALRALARIGPPGAEAAERLQRLAREAKDEWVRYASLEAAVAVGKDRDETIAFVRTMIPDKSNEIRGLAIRSLGLMGPRAASHTKTLIAALGDKAVRSRALAPDAIGIRAIRYDAAEALGRVGKPARDAVEPLRQMLRSDENREVRAAAALALYRINGEQSVIDDLIALLGDRKYGTAGPMEAAMALEAIGPKARRALPALAKTFSRKKFDIKYVAIRAIAAIGGPDAPRLLVIALKDEDDFVRQLAAEALGEMGNAAAPALEALKRIAEADPISYVRKAAKEAIDRIERRDRTRLR